VLHLIQQLDPIGVGARNLQECLLIQLDYLAEQGKGHALARELVEKCWAEVGRNKYADAARLLGVRSRAVQEAMDFVREHLNPYPGREFRLPWQSTAPDQVPTVRPDVIVRETGNPDRPYEVEVVSSPSLSLRVNRLYQSLWRQMQQTRWHSQQERQHVREYVARARQFIDNINQRRETLKCITECIVQEQYAFLDRGVLHLKPLTRVQIAERMGVHESTVGRAIVDKYVMLPSEEIVPFDLFFDTALPARRIIHHLVQHEDPYKPLSDDELVELLAERGFHLARRTVAKYRAELKILPYFQRKRY
jgi:RNA polymerase sigma-54 factor